MKDWSDMQVSSTYVSVKLDALRLLISQKRSDIQAYWRPTVWLVHLF